MSEVLDNPFAIRPRDRRRPLMASLRGLLIVGGLFVVVVLIQSQTRQWLLHRWVSGFADLSVGEQIERLLLISSLGDVATETLTRRIAAADEGVAAAAFELIREHQASWATRDDDSLARAHGRMLAGLAAILDDLPASRAGRVRQLLNQTILECVDQRGEAMAQTYAMANALSARLSPNQSAASAEAVAAADRNQVSAPSLVPLPVRLQTLDDRQTSSLQPVEETSQTPPTIIARGGYRSPGTSRSPGCDR
jgi:hypothetical protein